MDRARLLTVVLGVWLLCVLAAVAVQARGQEQQRQSAFDGLHERAGTGASLVSAYVDDVFVTVQRLAPRLTADPASLDDIGDATRTLGFESAEILDRQGRVLTVAPEAPSLMGVDLGARFDYLRSAQGVKTVSDVVTSVATGSPVVSFAIPLFGARYGVLSVALSPRYSALRSAVSRDATAGMHAYVVDAAGVVVVSTEGDGAGVAVRDLDYQSALAASVVKDRRVVAGAPIPGTPWIYVLDAPVDTVVAPVTSGDRREWGLLAGSAVLALVGLIVATLAVTSRAQARRERAEADQRFRLTVEHAPVGMTMVGLDRRFIEPNARLCRMLGYTDAELSSMRFDDVSHVDDLGLGVSLLDQLVDGGSDHFDIEKRYVRSDGSLLWGRLTVSAVRGDDGRPLYFVSQIEDVTEIRAAQEALNHRALYDSLTGLANRGLLVDRLTHALASSRRPRAIAVGFCDLDYFKLVNDSHGHHSGDAVLKVVASRLLEVVRSGDTVARMGGDEFILLLTDAGSVCDATRVLERARQAIEQAIEVDGNVFRVGLSSGVALAEEGDTAETLLRHSDSALYAAKHGGRGRCETYDAGNRQSTTIRRGLEAELRGAVHADQFELHYQPVVELVTRRVIAYEALVRWHHPHHGLLYPGDFIELAEESDRVFDIGAIVIDQACGFIAANPDCDWQVFVNVSPRHFGRGLDGLVTRALAASSVSAARLGLEITENGVLQAKGSSLKEMNRLRDAGIDIFIDDFGTGYSALTSVMSTPVSGIKLDRSFTADLGISPTADRIASTVAGLANSLGLRGVVEGIETAEQAELALRCGWKYAQGYYFGRPMPAGDLRMKMATESSAPVPDRLPRLQDI